MAIYADEAHRLPPTLYIRMNDRGWNWQEPEFHTSKTMDVPYGEHEIGEYKLVTTHRFRKKDITERLP